MSFAVMQYERIACQSDMNLQDKGSAQMERGRILQLGLLSGNGSGDTMVVHLQRLHNGCQWKYVVIMKVFQSCWAGIGCDNYSSTRNLSIGKNRPESPIVVCVMSADTQMFHSFSTTKLSKSF